MKPADQRSGGRTVASKTSLAGESAGGSDPRLEPAERWFDSHGMTPFAFQREVWAAYLEGRSGLLHAPTGLGKTLAVWMGPILEELDRCRVQGVASERAGTDGPRPASGLRVLWITPLRALAADTLAALAEPLEGEGLAFTADWRLESRTGDTTSSARRRQKERLPEVLVTTPESLSLLLSYEDSRSRFEGLDLVVVDELHELIGTKRGVQTELALARLRSWCPGLRYWGLSATLGNLDVAASVLAGDRQGELVRVSGEVGKKVEIQTVIPREMERFPWSGHLGIRLLEPVLARIEEAGTTLLFTNTRSQTEIWYQALLEARPAWAGKLGMHHGSIDRKLRTEVEAGLAAGDLKCVVCTSSLDLGIDFTPVEQVIQVGSPKGIARLLQRAGRSGHAPGQTSRIWCVPTHAFELVEFASVRDAARHRRVEGRQPLRRSLDVLVQHLVTCACGGGFYPEALLREVRSSDAYADLPDEEWRWALEFVTTGGRTLAHYPQYRKVEIEGGRYLVSDRKVAQRHRMNIGTITSDHQVSVCLMNGKRLGSVEEGFISRFRPGQQFLFAGRRLELVRLREQRAVVRVATKRSGVAATWTGTRLPLSAELSQALLQHLLSYRDGGDLAEVAEMKAMAPVLDVQMRWSRLPGESSLLIEQTRTRDGCHAFVYPFAGRLVHEGLGALAAHRLAREEALTLQIAANDYGFELHAPPGGRSEALLLDEAGWRSLLSPEDLLEDLLTCLNSTELARRQFREVAQIAGLVLPGFGKRDRSNRALQVSSSLLFDVFRNYDTDHPLLAQAEREILEGQLELTRLRGSLDRIAAEPIVVIDIASLSPLAFPLWADTLGQDRVSSEGTQKRLLRMLENLEAAAGTRDSLGGPERREVSVDERESR